MKAKLGGDLIFSIEPQNISTNSEEYFKKRCLYSLVLCNLNNQILFAQTKLDKLG